MSLVLSRVDYTNVGVTCRGTTKILPSNDSKVPQKFVVGDHDGVVHIFNMKKAELQIVFKSLPGKKIEKIVLGGGLSETSKDKIFVGYGNTVKGYTKKGKMFLEFDTNLVDTITSMHVLEADLAVCSRDIYHRYRNCKDADSYLVGEKLNDVILLPSGSSIVTVLACGDRAIRILTGTKNPTLLRLPSVPTVFSVFRENGREYHDRLLVGTQDGKIGLLVIHSNKTIRITWLINTYGSEITSMDTYELDGTAAVDIIVGRQDGTIEVFNFSGADESTTPLLRYQYNAGESISSVVAGVIGTPGHTEILVTTYSGKIFGLTTKPPGALEAGAASSETETINRLQAELDQLEAKLIEAREYNNFTIADALTPLILSVNYRMTLNRETATYLLSIELDTPIDNILIQSDAPVELLDESNNAVLSLSTADPSIDGNFVLATYRCQINTNQLETKIRTIEGQTGTLQIYVTTQIQPKCCRKIKIPILALSLHARIHDDENSDKKLSDSEFSDCYNELKLSGSFTVAEMHAWLSLALPELPERPTLIDNDVTFNYISTFIGSSLKCKYRKSSGIFSSENISTILILRDLLTKEATKRKIKLDISCHIKDDSIKKMLNLIMPQLNAAKELVENYQIINALQNWEMTDEPEYNLCTNYHELLNNEDDIRSKYLKNSNILKVLEGVITDLFIDWKRAKGSYSRVTNKMALEKLNEALKLRSESRILDIFMDKNTNNINNNDNNEINRTLSVAPLSQDKAAQDL